MSYHTEDSTSHLNIHDTIDNKKPEDLQSDSLGPVSAISVPSDDGHLVRRINSPLIERTKPHGDNNNVISQSQNTSELDITMDCCEILSDDKQQLLKVSMISNEKGARSDYVQWKVNPRTTPAHMLGLLSSAIALAIFHHLYFLALNNAEAGSKSQQRWATGFGTAFSFLTVAALKAACTLAYQQYIWTVFKAKPLELGLIDILFSLTSNPTGFLKFRLFSTVKLAAVVALVSWFLPLAGLLPPATLAVIAGQHVQTREMPMPALNWTKSPFLRPMFLHLMPGNEGAVPSSKITYLATQAAYNMAIVPAVPPFQNSSFSARFHGPSIQCSPANSSQMPIFQAYSELLIKDDYTVRLLINQTSKSTQSGWNFGESKRPVMLVATLFEPFRFNEVWNDTYEAPIVDTENNWNVTLPAEFRSENYFQYQTNDAKDISNIVSPEYIEVYLNKPLNIYVPQLWIQTATDSVVCLMGNSSYSVDFQYVNGLQAAVDYHVQDFKPFYVFSDRHKRMASRWLTSTPQANAYLSVFQSITSLLSGNITMSLYNSTHPSILKGEEILTEESSGILATGLGACNDFINSYWHDNAVGRGANGPVPWRESNQTFGPLPANITRAFIKSPWMCRNRTLQRGIEDLMNNMTISLLSSPDYTTNSTLTNVTFSQSRLVYQYASVDLILSYIAALIVTSVIIGLGFWSLRLNGVAHSISFSAIMATTRNPRLDILSRGHSLGALPLDRKVLKSRLRLGELPGRSGDGWQGERHVGFGLEDEVESLRKGEKYV